MRRLALLHGGPGDELYRLDADPHAPGDRPARRGECLRHRAHRARPARRRSRPARRRGRQQQGTGLYRPPHPGGRLHGDRLRGARDGAPVRRQPHVQRHPVELWRGQPQRDHLGRAGERLLGHGLRGHLRVRRPAAALRPVLVREELRRDHGLRVLRGNEHRRGPDGRPDRLRRGRSTVPAPLPRQ